MWSRLLPAPMIEVAPAATGEYESALQLLFGGLPQDEQRTNFADVMRALARGNISLRGLLVAKIDGVAVGSTLYLVQEDRTAFVWPPRVCNERPTRDVADALLRELVRRIEECRAWIGQSLISPEALADREALVRNGFEHLTDLRFLARWLTDEGCDVWPASPHEPPLERVVYQPGKNEERFARLIERTYAGTSDCPELEGKRTGEHALVSHRMSGDFDPSRWVLFRWKGQDAGVLLMNDHPEQRVWEVVYTGVARDCRGNGLGRRMLADGLSAARRAERSAVLLAVDSRNDYASKIYNELGFVETDRKSVHVYFPRRASAIDAAR